MLTFGVIILVLISGRTISYARYRNDGFYSGIITPISIKHRAMLISVFVILVSTSMTRCCISHTYAGDIKTTYIGNGDCTYSYCYDVNAVRRCQTIHVGSASYITQMYHNTYLLCIESISVGHRQPSASASDGSAEKCIAIQSHVAIGI